MKLKIKKGDTVKVIAGSDKGKTGSVIEVDPTALRIKVQGVKVMTHFDKKDGMKTAEGFINYSNVALLEASKADKKKSAKKKTASKNA